jgi:hypothetical protein
MIYRYTVKDGFGATVRQFRTNDADFALRTVMHDSLVHGGVVITREESESPMQPDFGRKS